MDNDTKVEKTNIIMRCFIAIVSFIIFHILMNIIPQELMQRDNTTKVDSINVLRCLYHFNTANINRSSMVYVKEGRLSVIIAVERNDKDTKEKVNSIAENCHKALGFGIWFTVEFNQQDTEVLPLEDAIRTGNLNMFSTVTRSVTRSVTRRRTKGRNAVATFSFSSALSVHSASSNYAVATCNANSSGSQARINQKYQEYFLMRVSLHDDCISHDVIFTPINQCQSYPSHFNAYQIVNPNARELTVKVWPHHDCSKGDEDVQIVKPWSTSECYKKTTYSWIGILKGYGPSEHEGDVSLEFEVKQLQE